MQFTHYKHTLRASYISYMSHAIINNYAPLLFITFQNSYGISVKMLGFLVAFNFGIQLCVDFFAAKYADKIGYRLCMILAHAFAAVGLVGLAILPEVVPNAYIGLLIAIFIYGLGGGLIEVLVSPIVEACPTDQKSGNMSLLHSFYCWGHVIMVIATTIFFQVFGIENWKLLAILWAIVPFVNIFYFAKVPIGSVTGEHQSHSMGQLFKMKEFWLFFILMLAAGSSEQAMSQWASAFAESGLKVSKAMGDLLGPCLFAIMMGVSRIVYAKNTDKISLQKYILGSCALCILTYLVAVFAKNPVIGLLGCGFCGFSVGIMWPGTLSMASAKVPLGGTAFFAFLALAGDIGCGFGPGYVGVVAEWFGDSLKAGLLSAIIFPIAMIIGVIILGRMKVKVK